MTNGNRRAQRPKRGHDGNVLVEGDTGTYAGPLGGAAPGASESGDLASREFGVPQADIPGGKTHIVNPQTRTAKTAVKELRPADYHKYHGVEPTEPDGYVTPPDATEERAPKPAPEPKYDDAVPVYLVAGPGKKEKTGVSPRNITVPAATGTTPNAGIPVRVQADNQDRVGVSLLNESATIIRIGENEADALEKGAALPASMTNYMWIATQDSLYAIADSGSSQLKLSVIEEYRAAGRSWTDQ